ncbi:MAG: 30S ribosomal protein S1 [Gemmatimonadetes bacterium]|nr:30S ribosomal protein S1 [Gemmatimonadota bacterium]
MADDPQAQEGEVQEESNDEAQASQVDAEVVADASETAEAGETSVPEKEAVPVEAAASEPEEDPASSESNESEFAQMLAESGADTKGEIKVGDKVSGVIAKIDGESAFVNYGGRGEAIIRTSELLNKDGEVLFAVGDQIEAFASKVDDEVQLTRSVSRTDGNTDALYQAFKAGMPVEGQVDAVNKWGMGIIFQGGVRGFCPISQIDTTYVKSAEDYRGKTFSFKIIEFRHQGRDIVVSRRALLEAEQNKEAEAVRAMLKKGAKLQGTVTRLQDFGAFVALGAGVEGLVHVSEISHQRVNQPGDVLQEGQEIEVVVIDTKGLGNRRKERISLSIKALEKNPWDAVREQFPAGTVATGKVDSLEDYGAFVELAEGIRGMVHVSEIADRRIAHPREVLSLEEEVRIVVLEADMRRQRLRLSIRQVESMESAANLRDFQERMKREQVDEPTGNALTDALRRAKLVN